ncbi:MAG: S9 family peptidase [Pseudomonadota bacterium]
MNNPRYLISSVSLLASLLIASPAYSEQDVEQVDPRKFTSDKVFELEYAAAPQVSPDGSKVIYSRRHMDKYKDSVASTAWMLDLRSAKDRPLFGPGESGSSIKWSPSGDRILFVSSNDGKPTLNVRFMDSQNSFTLATFEQSPGSPSWSPDGENIAFSMFVPSEGESFATAPRAPAGAAWADPAKVIDDLVFRFDGQGYLKRGADHLFVISADGGTATQVTEGDNGFGAPNWLDNSTLLTGGNEGESPELDPIESEIYKVDIGTKSVEALTTRDGPDHTAKASPNGKLVAYLGYNDELKAYQQTDLYVMNADGSNVRNLTGDYDKSIGDISWNNRGNAVYARVNVDGNAHIISVSLSGTVRTLVTDVGGTTLGRPYSSGNYSAANGVLAYTKADASKPADLAVVKSGSVKTWTNLHADLAAQIDFAPIEEFTVKSSHDDRDIEAWVALPKGFKADGSFPMILEIHGGPFAMYGPFFSAEIQRYAAEGYVTVYANPRGSTGYGEEFAQTIDKAYPSFDHDDLMSVVDNLVERKYVDKDRLYITGGSGGGVLTSWAVGKTDQFRAAATIKPVINWITMALAADISKFVSRHWMGMQPWEDPQFYWKQSPISLVGNVTTPTMVMVGEEDWRTPAWEAEQYYTALKVQGVDTVLVRIPGASHSIAARPSQLIAKVDNILGWFKKYDEEQPKPASSDSDADE